MDYKKIELKCGLEIHQQLEGKKLFCNCPTQIKEEPPDIIIKRFLRASSGETGKIDIAAVQETQKQKYNIYEAYKNSNCLIELDEQPPNNVNKEALKTAIQLSLMTKSKIIEHIKFMRKIIVNGSNTSGFQRTGLISVNGELETTKGKVKIPAIILEEDAARIIKEEKEKTTYRLDRLGIPLIEITTSADMHTPEHCLEVAEKIGMILRSTGKAKRGIGTIRQDINISIKEGNRIEIKGAQDIKLIPKLIELECKRQLQLIEIKKILKQKKFNEEIKNITEILKNCKSKIVEKNIQEKKQILGIKIKNCKGILGIETQQGKRFGTELSERAKVIAGVGGIFHSDELPKYGITQEEVNLIKKKLNCTEKDAFIFVCDEETKAKKALNAVQKRLNEATKEIPKEVRKANEDGTTTYLRPMPGEARMYPETDTPSIKITKKMIEQITIPEQIDIKAKRYERSLNLGEDLATKISKSEKTELFEKLLKNKNIKPAFIAETIVSYTPELLRNYPGSDPTKIKNEHIEQIFKALNNEEIAKESILQILINIAKGEKLDINKFKVIPEKELTEKLNKIVKENKSQQLNIIIGKAMNELRGKAQGSKIVEIIKKIVKKN